jgi:hypothetical protein
MAPCFNMNNPFKYARTPISNRRSIHLRRFQDPIQHDLYYGFLKHRAQARFRKELYALTWAQWQRIWTPTLWAKRGRGPRSLRLVQLNPLKGWSFKNCAVVEHATHMSEITLARLHTNPTHTKE